MTCADFDDAIQELVDGTLTGPRRQELEHHLSGCPSCTALVEELLIVRRAARALPALTPPDHVWERLAPVVSATAPQQESRPAWRDRVLVPLAIAAVLLAAVLITLLMRRLPQETPSGDQHAGGRTDGDTGAAAGPRVDRGGDAAS